MVRVNRMISWLKNWKTWFLIGSLLIMAAVLSSLDGAPSAGWGHGVFVYFLLLSLSALSLILAGQVFVASQGAVRLAWVASLLRLSVGVGLILVLPILGYAESEVTQAGYFYRDAFTRDQMAWQVASQGLLIWDAFSGIYPGDQYGGMLALSAAMYRVLSPTVHRPFLIIILTAAASGWGVLAVWKAGWLGSNGEGNQRLPLFAAAVFALYPEGVILGSTHMREAFVISAFAVALCGVVEQASASTKKGLILLFSGLAAMLIFQPPLALAGLLSLGILGLLYEFHRSGRVSWRKALPVGLLGIVLIVVVAIAWGRLSLGDGQNPFAVMRDWLIFNLVTETDRGGSEQVQALLGDASLMVRSVALSLYGLLQPFLPAAIFDPGNVFWRISGTLRALGWYFLAPLMAYALWSSFLSTEDKETLTFRWLAAWAWGWSWFTSLRAGGDQWDNPRYRAVFLGMQALLAGWILARQSRNSGLRRIILVEISLVICFSLWYINRYHLPGLGIGLNLGFLDAAVASIVLAVIALVLDVWLNKHSPGMARGKE